MKEFMLLKNVNIARQINGVWQLEKKDIHIEDGVIVAIEDQLFCCENTQFIDGGGALLLPGFIDVHRHLWETGFKGIGMDWLGKLQTPICSGYFNDSVSQWFHYHSRKNFAQRTNVYLKRALTISSFFGRYSYRFAKTNL